MGLTLDQLDAIVKEVIQPAVVNQVANRAPAWELVSGYSAEEKTNMRAKVKNYEFQNMNIYVPLKTQNMATYNVAPDESYRYGKTGTQKAQFSVKTAVSSTTIGKHILKMKNAGAVVNALKFTFESLSDSVALDLSRQVYGDGSGVIGVAKADATSSTTFEFAASTNGAVDFASYIPAGTYIKIGSNSAVEVTDSGDNTLTLASAQSWSAGDAVYKVNGSGSVGNELSGFEAMISSTSTYGNLNPSTYKFWKSYVDDTSETLTSSNIRSKMRYAFHQAMKFGKVDWILTNQPLFDLYADSLEEKVRIVNPKTELSGGWSGIAFMGATVLFDPFMPSDDKMYFLSAKDLVFAEYWPLEFEKGSDGRLLKLAGTLGYEVTVSWAGDIATTIRRAHSKLSNKAV